MRQRHRDVLATPSLLFPQLASWVHVLAAWLIAMAGCTSPSTGVVIVFDTNAPAARDMTITATAYHGPGMTNPGTPHLWRRGTHVDGGISLPASFGVTPASGGHDDDSVVLVVEAALAPYGTQPALSFRRIVRFRFVPHRTVTVGIFLSTECASITTGCNLVPAAQCTVAQRCEEHGRTCDAMGACVDPTVNLLADAGTDATISTDARPDAGADTRPDVSIDTGSESCVPNCAGRMCGPDFCGGSCGTCPGSSVCSAGTCTATCGTGLSECGSSCVDLQTDPGNCGVCGRVCPSGASCTSGACTCPTGTIACGASCVNPQSDRNHCGSCANVCGAGTSCQSGACIPDGCSGGLTSCSGFCVNLSNDDGNCGTCGNACPSGTSCSSGACVCPAGLTYCGACVNTSTDTSNCGSCGHACTTGSTCVSGSCVTGGCPTGTTLCGGSCVDLGTDLNNCGSCGFVCTATCSGGVCSCPATPCTPFNECLTQGSISCASGTPTCVAGPPAPAGTLCYSSLDGARCDGAGNCACGPVRAGECRRCGMCSFSCTLNCP